MGILSIQMPYLYYICNLENITRCLRTIRQLSTVQTNFVQQNVLSILFYTTAPTYM